MSAKLKSMEVSFFILFSFYQKSYVIARGGKRGKPAFDKKRTDADPSVLLQ